MLKIKLKQYKRIEEGDGKGLFEVALSEGFSENATFKETDVKSHMKIGRKYNQGKEKTKSKDP